MDIETIPTKTCSLLLVDDFPDNLITLEAVITEYLPNCVTICVSDPYEALTISKCQSFDGALFDVQMPGMDGVELCRQIKEKHPSLPVILITAHQANTDVKVSGMAAGADDFITKPINNEELIARIKVMLRMHDAEQKLSDLNQNLQHLVEERTRELTIALEQARKLDQLKSEFLAIISHEVRTPLNAIIGFSDLLINDPFDMEEVREYAAVIQNSGQNLLNIINGILSLSLIESKNISINQDQCLLSIMMDEIYDSYSDHHKIVEKKIELRKRFPSPSPHDLIYMDEPKFRQILFNLIDNAIKFTSSGFVELGYDWEGDNQINIYICDTGIGIPPEKYDLIFESFQQIDSSISRQYEGLGLGVTLASKLTSLLGGSIRVESELGQGSTFHLSFPVKIVEASESISIKERSKRAS